MKWDLSIRINDMKLTSRIKKIKLESVSSVWPWPVHHGMMSEKANTAIQKWGML